MLLVQLQVLEPSFFLYAYLFHGAYGQDLLDFVLAGGKHSKGGGMTKGCGSLGCGPLGDSQATCLDPLEFLLKSFGVSTHGFNLASKIFDDDQSERYEQGIMDFEVPSSMFAPLTMAAVVNLAASIWGLVRFSEEAIIWSGCLCRCL